MKNLMPLLFIATAIAIFFMYINPRFQNVKIIQTQIEEYKSALVKAEELRVARDELLTRYNSLSEAELNKLERIVPDKINVVQLIADIDSAASKYGITIEGVKVTEEVVDDSQGVVEATDVKPYLTTTIAFQFSSTYLNLLPFLRDLEKSLQIIDVKSVNFNSDESTSSLYKFDISIQAYRLREQI